jgi:beta-galactosidase
MPDKLMRGAAIAALIIPALYAATSAPVRSVRSLDSGWQLYRMPGFALWPSQQKLAAGQIQQLNCPAPGDGWQPVRLPDDYVVRGEFAREPNAAMLVGGAVCPLGARECEVGGKPQGKPGDLNRPGRDPYAGHGYLPVYPAWYRRTLSIPASAKGKILSLDFGGVYRDAIVFVNGKFLYQHPSGYTGFRVDITSAVNYGAENSVEVFVDPRWFEGWWYEGGGMYRHVSLITTDPLRVTPWGVFVDSKVNGADAQLTVQTTVRNGRETSRKFTLVSQAIDPSGHVIASASGVQELAGSQEATFSQQIAVRDAQLWSLEHPNLYKLATTIRTGAVTVDKDQTTFGIRTLRFDPEKGFFLNGKHVEILGVCVHHDFPGVGIAAPDNLWAWRLAKLKAMGANAYRTAHNPVSSAFYDAADRMGIMVMDENRHLGDSFDPKAPRDNAPYSDLADVKAMVLQHRNHPSIIMWSLCNEEGVGPTPYGAKMFAAMRDAVRKIDPTRPTTGGINGGYTKDGYISVEDILGMNYHNVEFANVHKTFPGLMIYGSEDLNSKTSRGTLETSRESGRCSEFSCGASPDTHGDKPWLSWVPVVENAYVAGQFIWTGFDYRGEPNPYSWPAATSQTGTMDLCGFPKPVYYYWKAAWSSQPSVYIFPDWNLRKSESGKNVLVRAYSNCDRVELLLNGKSLGAQDMPANMFLDWHVPYAPGKLTAVGYKGGKAVARYTAESAGAPAALRLTSEQPRIAANGEAVAPIEVALVDAKGNIVSNADRLIQFTVSGAGTLAGVANGDPTSHERNVANQRTTYRGLSMALVRASERPGFITLTAQAAGLPVARIVIPTGKAKPGK